MYPPPPREIDLTAHKSKGSTRESQSGPGKGYRAGKSDTPLGIVDLDFRFIANGREKIPTIRACVAGGGWRRGISTGFNCVRVLFLLRG